MNEEVKAHALRILEKRDVSRKMLLDKLMKKGASEADAQEVADWLCSLGVVNDERYAALVVRHYGAKGYGRRRIEQELYARGIARDLWEGALTELRPAEDTVYALLCRKLRGTPCEAPDLQRARGFLLRRGYSYEQISAAIDRYQHTNEEISYD